MGVAAYRPLLMGLVRCKKMEIMCKNEAVLCKKAFRPCKKGDLLCKKGAVLCKKAQSGYGEPAGEDDGPERLDDCHVRARFLCVRKVGASGRCGI
jgi:hypothetical protein